MTTTLPRWADLVLIPALNLLLAFLVAGLVVLFIGEDPIEAVRLLLVGSLGSSYAIGFTLYYATTFVFTGLSVAIAFHAGLFNIGSEGQAALGGIGCTLVCLAVPWPAWWIALPFAILGAGLFGAAWAFIPGYLQAKRGSHVVITTIMFNFIASALVVYLLVNVLKAPGMAPETRNFPEGTFLPAVHEMLGAVGIEVSKTPMNITSFLALVAAFLSWVLIWRTRLGYEMRAFGHSEPAAVYAGIDPVRITIIAMLLSGAHGRPDGAQRGHGLPAPAGARLRRRRRLRRHRRLADGPLAPGRRGAGGDPVRHPLPGRGGARLRHALDQPRDDRGHPGPRHPLHRRPGEPVRVPMQRALPARPAGAA